MPKQAHRHRDTALCLVGLAAGSALAADAALNWASLSGDQQYILARFGPRWAQLDLAENIKDGVASHTIVADDLEKGMRDGKIESSDLSNAIEHHRTPDRDALPASANTLPP